MTLVLDRSAVMSVLDMKDCIGAMEKAFAELSNGTAVLPLRIAITPPGGLAIYMPAYLKEMQALACKVVSVYKDNPVRHNLPTTIGKVLLQDPATGDVLCIMDGGYLTAVRTGAASGVATRLLARDARGQTCAVFGAGVQAKMQLWAMATVRDLAKVLVHDVSTEAVDRFIAEMGPKLGLEIVRAAGPEAALQADIVCAATSSATPVFDGARLREGTHVNGIGSHTPNARELDTATIARARLFGDSREACFKEAGDIMIPLKEGAIAEAHFLGELGDLVTGKLAGRTNDREITLFKSNGIAIQDAAAAKLVYEKARSAGIGTEISI